MLYDSSDIFMEEYTNYVALYKKLFVRENTEKIKSMVRRCKNIDVHHFDIEILTEPLAYQKDLCDGNRQFKIDESVKTFYNLR